MKPTQTWILIANSKHAHIMENKGSGKGLRKIPEKTFQAPEVNEYSDQEGRSFNSGSSMRHKLEAHHGEDPVLRDYITTIINSLAESYANKKFDQLVVCAAPATLGTIRNHLPNTLKTATIAEVAKDLTNIPDNQLADHFEEILVI